MVRIQDLLLGKDLEPEVLAYAERSTYVTVDKPLHQYSSFYLRAVLAAILATGGIATSSTTTVIGAMLVASLMSPMLGTALAVVRGKPAAVFSTILHTVLGTLTVIAVSILVASMVPAGIGLETNLEVQSRISPRFVDLFVALTSGFVAALALVRSDIPEVIPGIAISASIVPPLCVAGVGIYAGDMSVVRGSLLLFGTNYISIQFAGAFLFALIGLGSKGSSDMGGGARYAWYGLTVAAVFGVAMTLSAASSGIVRENETSRIIQDVSQDWAQHYGYRISEFDITNDELSLEISGEGRAPLAEALAARLKSAGITLGRVRVAVRQERTIDIPPEEDM